MASLVVERRMAAPPETVFEVMTDHQRYPEFTPIRRAELEREGRDDPNGVGAIRALHLAGPPIRELVTAYEPPSLFQYELISGQPVRDFVGTVRLQPEPGGGTLYRYEISFEPPLPVPGLGATMATAIKLAIGRLLGFVASEAERRAAA